MPNWCMNQFTVKHNDKEMLDKFCDGVSKGNLFQTFIPMPDELLETEAPKLFSEEERTDLIEKYGHDNWYSWRLANWGVKWDIGEGAIVERLNDNTAQGSFDTPWNPPIYAFEALTEMGFDLDVLFDEEGMGLIGVFNMYGEQTYDYDFEDPDWKDKIDNDDVVALLDERYDMWVQDQEDQQDYFDSLEDEQEEEQSNG